MIKYYGEYITINDVRHYFLLPYTLIDAPFVLFLHGGPGESEMMMVKKNQQVFNENFNVIYYDQRGTGKTLRKNKKKKPDINLILKDLKEIIAYLKEKYQQDKIMLLGYSWGTVIASIYIKNNPEDISGYIGLSQLVDFQENEIKAYVRLKEEIIQANNSKDLVKLFKLNPYPEQSFNKAMIKKLKKFRKLQGKYNFAVKMTWKNFWQMTFNPYFQFIDILYLLKSVKYNKELYSFMINFSLYNYDYQYDIPIFYLAGDRDYQTPHFLASEYFEKIEAPYKRLFIVENAGHAVIDDNPLSVNLIFSEIKDFIKNY